MLRFKQFMNEGVIEKGTATVKDIVKKLSNRTWVVFDSETTGLSAKSDFVIITELAAMAIDGNTGKELARYHKKSKLTPEVFSKIKQEEDRMKRFTSDGAKEYMPTMQFVIDDIVSYKNKYWIAKTNLSGIEPTKKNKQWKEFDPTRKSIKDLLSMTAYDEKNTEFVDVQDTVLGFKKFVDAQKNPIVIAHNAKFDMYQVNNAISAIDKKSKVKADVLDTLPLTKNYVIPMLQEMEKNGDDRATHALDILKNGKKKAGANLGVLGQLFKVETKMWHSGLADTLQLAGILSQMISFLKTKKI